jgi:hypothetical protein
LNGEWYIIFCQEVISRLIGKLLSRVFLGCPVSHGPQKEKSLPEAFGAGGGARNFRRKKILTQDMPGQDLTVMSGRFFDTPGVIL